MTIVTEFKRLFILALFDTNENVLGTIRIPHYGEAMKCGKSIVESGKAVSFKIVPHDEPVHGITYSHW